MNGPDRDRHDGDHRFDDAAAGRDGGVRVVADPSPRLTRCASPHCLGRCTSTNRLGIGDVCAAPRFYDHEHAARIDTDFDIEAENRDDRDDIHGMREIDQ